MIFFFFLYYVFFFYYLLIIKSTKLIYSGQKVPCADIKVQNSFKVRHF